MTFYYTIQKHLETNNYKMQNKDKFDLKNIFNWKLFRDTNIFTLLTQFLVIILPFYVILKLSFEVKLGISWFGILIKEFVIVLLFLSLVYEFIKAKIYPKFGLIDYLILSYIAYGLVISVYNHLSLWAIFAWWRYDFEFLIVFMIFKQWAEFLKTSFNSLVKLFLYSASTSLFISLSIKFLIKEEILQYFGYSIYVADWQFKGWVPIYHWVEASGLRRFQWILDSPNAMAFFLLIYAGIIGHFFRKKLEYHVILIYIFLVILVVLTYSRSALLGIWFAVVSILLLNAKTIFLKYKKWLLIITFVLSIFSSLFYIVLQDKISNIFVREGSTTGHFERMEVGINRFLDHPFGQWLATSWPWFRAVEKRAIDMPLEKYYIPESWFIQQLVEWWFIYFSLFITILLLILLETYKKSVPLFGAFITILIMNMLLHIFEATYLSILLFLFLWILYAKNERSL